MKVRYEIVREVGYVSYTVEIEAENEEAARDLLWDGFAGEWESDADIGIKVVAEDWDEQGCEIIGQEVIEG